MRLSIMQAMLSPSLFLRFCLLTGAYLLLSGCWHTKPQELFPLAVGSHWKYRTGDSATLTENAITGSLLIGDTRWFLYREYGEKFWIRNGAKGQLEAVNLYNKGESAAIFEQLDAKSVREELLFRFPAKPGDTWTMLENEIRYEGRRDMTVPAGSFSCHFYSITQYGQTYSHTCIAEQVGIVFSDNLLDDGRWENSVLVEWQLTVPESP